MPERIAELLAIGLDEGVAHLFGRPVALDSDPQRMDLPDIGHIRHVADADRTDRQIIGFELRPAPLGLRLEDGCDLAGFDPVETLLERLREVIAHIRDGASHGAQDAGIFRHQHRADPDIAHQRAAMERARAAEGDESEVARVEPPFDREKTNAPRHALIDDRDDGFGGRLETESELFAEIANRLARAIDIEAGLRAAHAACRVDAAEHDVRVRYGWLFPAPPIGDGPGDRAGAAGADLQHSAAIDRGDAAAAGADGMHIDHRQTQRNAEIEIGDLGDRRLARNDDGDVEARAAHVGGDYVG